MRIRTAVEQDAREIRDVHLSAFPVEEAELVATLAVDLLAGESAPPTQSFVAEADGAVIGHIVFSPVAVHAIEDLSVYILAPLAVRPEHQKSGVGSRLVECGMEHLAELGVDVVLVYGDPRYYGKFGFSEESARTFTPPHTLQFPHGWLACVIRDGGSPEKPAGITCVGPLSDPGLW